MFVPPANSHNLNQFAARSYAEITRFRRRSLPCYFAPAASSASSSIAPACETLPAPSVRITSPSRAVARQRLHSRRHRLRVLHAATHRRRPPNRLHQPSRIDARNRLLAGRINIQHLQPCPHPQTPAQTPAADRASAYTGAAGTAPAPAHIPHPAPPAASPESPSDGAHSRPPPSRRAPSPSPGSAGRPRGSSPARAQSHPAPPQAAPRSPPPPSHSAHCAVPEHAARTAPAPARGSSPQTANARRTVHRVDAARRFSINCSRKSAPADSPYVYTRRRTRSSTPRSSALSTHAVVAP